MNPNHPASNTLRICLELGVREFCVCGGSRNRDLVFLIHNLPPPCRHWIFVDERSAGFFALGRARASQRPVAVVTTSGTAAAELLPCTIEAHYLGTPIIALTADRPLRFRGTGAPQSIDQSALFGPHAVYWETNGLSREMDLPHWDVRGPLHLNVLFEEPEAPVASLSPPLEIRSAPWNSDSLSITDWNPLLAFLNGKGRLLVIAGHTDKDWNNGWIDWLSNLGAPIMAERTSGFWRHDTLRPLLLNADDWVLRQLKTERVLRLGGVPSVRFWRDLESHADVEVFSLAPTPFSGLARPSTMTRIDPTDDPPPDPAKSQSWPEALSVAREMAVAADRVLDKYPSSEPSWIQWLGNSIPSDALLFVGNSLVIREWNRFSRHTGRAWVNRGANGIDGCLSTFAGLVGPETREAWGVFGDLTALYDLGAGWILDQLPGKLRIVIINNGGGKIFGHLPGLEGVSVSARSVLEARHDVRFEHWAHMWNFEWLSLAGARPESVDLPDRAVIEIRPDSTQTDHCWECLSR